jgi:nucleotide-binding universal stress UspA family protein
MPSTESFRSILVPVDGSPLAERAIPLAIEIAKRTGAKVRLALVHQEIPDVPVLASPETYVDSRLKMQRSENAYLRALSEHVTTQLGRRVSATALSGPAAATLIEYARDSEADLVVMTTHGRGGIQRAWLGSVVDQMIRNLSVPVLAVRASETSQVESPASVSGILVPLDGSPLAEDALQPAARMARLWSAKISLVRIVQPVLIGTDPALPLASTYDEQLTRLEIVAAQEYLDAVSLRLRNQGVESSAQVMLGGPTADTILQLAQSKPVSMIALATHGRGGMPRLVLGSVADKLIRGADVPVLVVRPDEATKEHVSAGASRVEEDIPAVASR